MFKEVTDLDLCMLWNYTNLCDDSIRKVCSSVMAEYASDNSLDLWRLINNEVKSRGIKPHTFTKTVETIAITEVSL